MEKQAKRVTLFGGTGNLGQLIGGALLSCPGVELALLVRPGSRSKAAALEARGAHIIEGSVDEDPHGLADALRGSFCVVSALQGGPDVMVGTQSKLLAAARSAGVKRFIPSDFSFDFFGLDEGENINSDWRRRFAVQAEAQRGEVQVVHVLNGCFLDVGVLFGFLGMFDLKQGRMFLWGDGRAPMDFTTYADTAAYTARAATDDKVPDRFAVAGDTLSFWELKRETEAASHRSFTVVEQGPLTALDAEIKRRQTAEPANVLAWLPLMYLRGMYSGKGQLRDRVEHHYPDIKPTTVRQYVAQHLP